MTYTAPLKFPPKKNIILDFLLLPLMEIWWMGSSALQSCHYLPVFSMK